MKKTLNILLWLSALIVPCAAQVSKISQEPVASALVAGDDLVVNVTNTGLGTWTTKRINLASFMASGAVTNNMATVALLTAASNANNSAVAGVFTSNLTYSGLNKYTNNPQIFQPRVLYLSNAAVNIVHGSTTFTAPSGTWDNWRKTDNFYNLAATEQYTFVSKLSATTAQFYPAGQTAETGMTGWAYSPVAAQTTDINGQDNGHNIDPGGCMGLFDGSGSGAAPPSMIFGSPAVSSVNWMEMDLVGTGAAPGLYGPGALSFGGLQSIASTSTRGFGVSAGAPFNATWVLSTGQLDVEHGITNYNLGSGGGNVEVDAAILKYLAEVVSPAQVQAAGTVAISGGTMTGTGTAFNTALANCKVIFVNGQEYHVQTISSDTSATVYEGVSQAGGSSLFLEPDGLSVYANNTVTKNTGTHWGGSGEMTIREAQPQLNLSGDTGPNYYLQSASGNLNIGQSVTGGQNPVMQIQANAPNTILTLTTAGAAKINGGASIRSGTGSPAGVVSGSVGDLWLRTDGGASTTFYVKESGSATTGGWVAK